MKRINSQEKAKLQQNSGKKKLPGREIIQNLMKNNKNINNDAFIEGDIEEVATEKENGENNDSDHGSAWDLTEFTNALKEAEHKDDSKIKDYGDGSNPIFGIMAK